jgi:hypothetical protein
VAVDSVKSVVVAVVAVVVVATVPETKEFLAGKTVVAAVGKKAVVVDQPHPDVQEWTVLPVLHGPKPACHKLTHLR